MKFEITCLMEAQQCDIIAKLSKPNTPSKWAPFDDANNEDIVMKIQTWCCYAKDDADNDAKLKKNHLSMTKSSFSRHLANLKVLPTPKALKLYTTSSSASKTNRFAPTFRQKLDKCTMNCDDGLKPFNKTFTNRHCMSSVKNSCVHEK